MAKVLDRYVRIACISDTHCNEEKIPGGIPECDILIHAGDMTFRGRYENLEKFNDWGNSIPLPPERKICIPGNHDLTFEYYYEKAEYCVSGWTVLMDTSTHVMGLNIHGTPWSPTFGRDWAFNQERGKEAREQWKSIPEDTDVLVVHGPPRFYGDLCPNGHQGCDDLAVRLNDIRPALTVCGHIHEGYGLYTTPWGTLVNASIMNGGYRPINDPIVVNIPVFRDV